MDKQIKKITTDMDVKCLTLCHDQDIKGLWLPSLYVDPQIRQFIQYIHLLRMPVLYESMSYESISQ